MKKCLIFIFLVLAVALIFFALQGDFSVIPPSPSVPPTISQMPEPEPSEPPQTEAPTHTEDPRNEEPVIRAEIAKLISDAKELLNEGLSDDASMILRDLRTRDLTDAEQAQVDALNADMSKIGE